MTNPSITTLDSSELKQRITRFQQVETDILTQVRRIIVGQEEVLEQVLIALFVGGHCLITGMPGTAKTLMVRTIAETLGLTFRRIQFTPDLMPSDITGTDIIEEDVTTGHRNQSQGESLAATEATQQEDLKQIIVGSVIGGFMFVILLSSMFGIWFAWRRSVRLREAKGVEFEMLDRGVEVVKDGDGVGRVERETP